MLKACLAGSTYAKALSPLGLGEPQWYPEYQGRPGDVGFFEGGRGGRFHRIHNILESAEEQGGGNKVPADFEAFHPSSKGLWTRLRDRNSQNLMCSQVKEIAVDVGATADIALVGGGFEYSCSSGSAAVLVLSNDLHSQGLYPSKDLKAYIKRHAPSWYAFVDDALLGGQDLHLVTERKYTFQPALASFSQAGRTCRIGFQLGLGMASANAGVSRGWVRATGVEHRTPEPTNPAEDRRNFEHSVFLRCMVVRIRRWVFIREMKAAASPREDSPSRDDEHDGSSSEQSQDSISAHGSSQSSADPSPEPDGASDTSSSAFSKTVERHPASAILDYIFNVSAATIAIASNEDIDYLARKVAASATDSSPVCDETELGTLLLRHRPAIQVEFGAMGSLLNNSEQPPLGAPDSNDLQLALHAPTESPLENNPTGPNQTFETAMGNSMFGPSSHNDKPHSAPIPMEIVMEPAHNSMRDFTPLVPPSDFLAVSPNSPFDSFELIGASLRIPLTPSYNGSYQGSPYTTYSELSCGGQDASEPLGPFDADESAFRTAVDDYDPAVHDVLHQPSSSLHMFGGHFIDGVNSSNQQLQLAITPPADDLHEQHSPFDHLSPANSHGGYAHSVRSRASSFSSMCGVFALDPPPTQHFDALSARDKPQSPSPLMNVELFESGTMSPPTISAPDGDGHLGAGSRGPSPSVLPTLSANMSLYDGPPAPGTAGVGQFLSPSDALPGAFIRRSVPENSGRPDHRRQWRSEDMRGPPAYDARGSGGIPQFDDVLPVPSIMRSGHQRRASSGSRSERGVGLFPGGPAGGSLSARTSPYPSPNASPRNAYDALPPDVWITSGAARHQSAAVGLGTPGLSGMPGGADVQAFKQGSVPPGATTGGDARAVDGVHAVQKTIVTTHATKDASEKRRKVDANFVCPVPGCGSTFTRYFNLEGHLRSHNDEEPYQCKWPGCNMSFVRQRDCKRHENLHLKIRPFTCDWCKETFARVDALNRHLKSECSVEYQDVQEESTVGGYDALSHHAQGGLQFTKPEPDMAGSWPGHGGTMM